jgi:type VI protein secretion system component Hcp
MSDAKHRRTAMDETKKPEQQEQNTESATGEERNQELSSKELDDVAGGTVALTYGAIQWTYTKQKPDGTAGGNVAAKWDLTQNKAS